MIPRAIISPPEKAFQKLGGTQISTVLALSKREKTIIEILSEAIIMSGIFFDFVSSALAPKTIGRSGRTHGARTVRTHERNAIARSVIVYIIYK